jgi:uncharacterized membrane protein
MRYMQRRRPTRSKKVGNVPHMYSKYTLISYHYKQCALFALMAFGILLFIIAWWFGNSPVKVHAPLVLVVPICFVVYMVYRAMHHWRIARILLDVD